MNNNNDSNFINSLSKLNLNDGCKQLMNLVKNNANIELIKQQIILGADINYKNKNGYNILMIACINKNYEVVKLLLENNVLIDNNRVNNNYNINSDSALMLSVNNIDILKLLIKYKSNVNYQNVMGYTALMKACLNKNLDSVKLLIENKANLNALNKLNESALSLSCDIYNNSEIIEYLILSGANINNVDYFGNTPIYNLCCNYINIHNKIRLIKLFISNGCNINHKNEKNESIIDYGYNQVYFSIEIFKFLILYGCEYNKNIKYIDKYNVELYLNSKQYLKDYYDYHIEKSALLFSKMVLLSDDYLKIKEL